MGQIVAVHPASSPSTPEVWQSLPTLATNYSKSGTGMQGNAAYGQYKLMPNNTLQIRANIIVAAGAAPGGTTGVKLCTLPIGYRPTATRFFALAWLVESIATGSNNSGGYGAVTSTGDLWVYGGANVTGQSNFIVFEANIALD
jgi:hypothetical protein